VDWRTSGGGHGDEHFCKGGLSTRSYYCAFDRHSDCIYPHYRFTYCVGWTGSQNGCYSESFDGNLVCGLTDAHLLRGVSSLHLGTQWLVEPDTSPLRTFFGRTFRHPYRRRTPHDSDRKRRRRSHQTVGTWTHTECVWVWRPHGEADLCSPHTGGCHRYWWRCGTGNWPSGGRRIFPFTGIQRFHRQHHRNHTFQRFDPTYSSEKTHRPKHVTTAGLLCTVR